MKTPKLPSMRNSPDPFAPPRKARPARANTLSWILEPLEQDAGFMRRKMFGCDAAYLDGLLYLVVADREYPWNGVMVCTSHDRQAALMDDMTALAPHPELPKWLYLPQTHEAFESVAEQLAALALQRDPRMGVAPRPKTKTRPTPKSNPKAARANSWRDED